jgi:hypothetical protein
MKSEKEGSYIAIMEEECGEMGIEVDESESEVEGFEEDGTAATEN